MGISRNNILLLSTASISVYLSAKLRKRLEIDGYNVTHICTKNAWNLWMKSGKMDSSDPSAYISFDAECQKYFASSIVDHINLVNSNDICVVCPADFNIVGKMSNGIADDVVSSILSAWLGSGKPIYIAEAMNTMMYANPMHLANVDRIKKNIPNVKFITPTVKRLACGDYGIGALADINAIADIVESRNSRWVFPISTKNLVGAHKYIGADEYKIVPPRGHVNFDEYLPRFNEPGSFGAVRKYDIHEGVDIYCKEGSDVFAVEDGIVVASYQYTGENANCEWWNDTWCIKVKGHSGVITYGELKMPTESEFSYPEVGTPIRIGEKIGVVGTVLKNGKLRKDIRNHNTAMLHMELRTENRHLDGWKLGEDRDKILLDPTPYLHNAI